MKSGSRFSEKELSDLKASRNCFKCGGSGHFAHNCPMSDNVRTNKKTNKPLGLASFSVGIELVEPESDMPKNINDVSLGMIVLRNKVVSEIDTCNCSCTWNPSSSWDCEPMTNDVDSVLAKDWQNNYPYRE